MQGDQDPRTYAIIGAAMEVHRQLGHGFLEAVYQEAVAIELGLVGIPFQKEVELPVVYKGRKLSTFYKADFLCFESVIVELKALSELSSVHEAQILNYLKATGLSVGLLLNFGALCLEFRRLIFSSRSASLRHLRTVLLLLENRSWPTRRDRKTGTQLVLDSSCVPVSAPLSSPRSLR